MKCNSCCNTKNKLIKCDKCKTNSQFCSKCLEMHKKLFHNDVKVSKTEIPKRVSNLTEFQNEIKTVNKKTLKLDSKNSNKLVYNENEGNN